MLGGKHWNYHEFSEQVREDIRNIILCNFPGLTVKFGYVYHPDEPDMKVDTFRLAGEGKEDIYPEYNLWDWYQQNCYLDNGNIAKTVKRMGQQYERDVCEVEKKRLEKRIAELDKQVPPKWVTELDTMLECLDSYKREQNKAAMAVMRQLENMGISIEGSMLRTLGKEDIMQYVAESRNEKTAVPEKGQEETEYGPAEDTEKEKQQREPETGYEDYGEPGRKR